ncbi:DUF72 domain-containing protein [Jejuia pallidilutea]|uniref:DUF72 domain-containing protein n=1 Tax=Jejuia pallidilutea TaxID=504487 RepID=A0A090WAG5_9FLAO|nr:DUF72 domain-containing protein [Jejuia pallidilutea]GAL67121.1 hypothetical protein JCM19301_2286 [Jejuia pallidilutea]GAL73218.1 hypothetical protein JCM19302_2079 [Jejuia pallidilutea]GAL90682.1 hypothetical protein JCM19538_447 [Jejuia pallidilutea]
MKFGSVDTPELVDFTLPKDHPDTKRVLKSAKKDSKTSKPDIYVGCAKWNRADLKGFYPRGTKDELAYYSSQFNSIELNATFYRIFPAEQFATWYNKTPKGFKFFPKLNQEISHWKRLNGTNEVVENYLYNASNLKEKLGTIFLQMHNNFTPKDFVRVVEFVEHWPKHMPLAVEFRHTDWYNDKAIAENLYQLLEANNISNVIVDTAGRRDLMHMRLTNTTAFIRYVGANHQSDYTRLDDWVERLKHWKDMGIKEIDFFIHQNIEKESPLLSAYFIEKINRVLGCNLTIPNEAQQNTLF